MIIVEYVQTWLNSETMKEVLQARMTHIYRKQWRKCSKNDTYLQVELLKSTIAKYKGGQNLQNIPITYEEPQNISLTSQNQQNHPITLHDSQNLSTLSQNPQTIPMASVKNPLILLILSQRSQNHPITLHDPQNLLTISQNPQNVPVAPVQNPPTIPILSQRSQNHPITLHDPQNLSTISEYRKPPSSTRAKSTDPPHIISKVTKPHNIWGGQCKFIPGWHKSRVCKYCTTINSSGERDPPNQHTDFTRVQAILKQACGFSYAEELKVMSMYACGFLAMQMARLGC